MRLRQVGGIVMTTRSVRRVRAGRWLAVLGLGVAVGAATVLYADAGTSGSTDSAGPVIPAETASANTSGASDTRQRGNRPERPPDQGRQGARRRAEAQPDQPLDAATRAALQQQLVARARRTALPDRRRRERAGYHLVGGFGPGAGAHYIGGRRDFVGGFDAAGRRR